MRKQLQRMLTGLVLCAVLTSTLVVPAAAAGFSDVPSGHWAAADIQRCVEQGFFKGRSETQFGLGKHMTRAAFTVVLCRFFGWETPAPMEKTYQDVPADAWYAGAVEAAYANGALTGQQENFRPDAPITREELAVMLVRAMGYGSIAGLAQDFRLPFTDVVTNTGYIRMAYDMGIMSGTSGTAFSPDRKATREQVAVILMRLYDRLHGEKPETIAIVSSETEIGTADVVAISAARAFAQAVKRVMDPGAAAAVQTAAHQAGAKTLLRVSGTAAVLTGDVDRLAESMVKAVADGGYDGLFLDIPRLTGQHQLEMNHLVRGVHEGMGDGLLYVAAEAPARNGTRYEGYDFQLLSALADRVVLRASSYAEKSEDFTTAPVEPLEEVYYGLTSMKGRMDPAKLALMITVEPSAWSGDHHRKMTASELEKLLKADTVQTHYSDRYACSYLVGTDENDKDVAVWYLDSQSVKKRLEMAQFFGLSQVCLPNWEAVSAEIQAVL